MFWLWCLHPSLLVSPAPSESFWGAVLSVSWGEKGRPSPGGTGQGRWALSHVQASSLLPLYVVCVRPIKHASWTSLPPCVGLVLCLFLSALDFFLPG